MHDDQHGTAVVVLAALSNALKVAGKAMADYIVPSMFDRRVAETVAQATWAAAWASGVARKARPAE